MADNIRTSGTETEAPETSKEEIALATDIMHAMVKTAKGFRMYQPNNPLLQRFTQELNDRMNRHLGQQGEYKLDVDQFELRYKGTSVYENRDPKESMAFRLYSDGIRSVIFSEGLEERELGDFLEIVGIDRPSDIDDDIVTLLWERDMPHLTYILAEDFLEFDPLVEGGGAGGSQQEKIRGIYNAIPETVLNAPMALPQHIFSITEEETGWLREAREADEKRKPLDEVINILTAILGGAKDGKTFGDFLVIMAKLTGNVMLAGEMVYALRMIRFLHNLATSDSVSAEQRRMVGIAMGKILNEKTVKVLQKTIDTTDVISLEDLRELLQVFGSSSLGAMCELLGLVEKMKMRRIILEVLVDIGKENPDAFTPYLADQRWYLVRNMIFILARLGRPVALDPIVRLIGHKEPRVRREVLSFLDHYPDPKAKTYLLKFLRDESSAVRIKALQALGRSKLPMALKSIAAITEAEDFDELGIAEKKAVYEALGELGGEQTVPLLRSLLLKKFWFKKSKERDSVACAVAGLLKVRTASAAAALEEARVAIKGDELRVIVVEALESLAAERAKAAAEQRSR